MKIDSASEKATKASCVISQIIAKRIKSFSDAEYAKECSNEVFFFYRNHGCSSPRCTMILFQFVLFRTASHNCPGYWYKCLKLLINVKCWAHLARFPGILALRARSSSSPLCIAWPRNLSCLCSIQQSSLRFCPIFCRTVTLVWNAVYGIRRILR